MVVLVKIATGTFAVVGFTFVRAGLAHRFQPIRSASIPVIELQSPGLPVFTGWATFKRLFRRFFSAVHAPLGNGQMCQGLEQFSAFDEQCPEFLLEHLQHCEDSGNVQMIES